MGTREGGRKTSQRLLERFGSPEAVRAWRQSIGRKGGLKSRGSGFGSDKVGADGLTGKERARIAGAKGGRISRRRDV